MQVWSNMGFFDDSFRRMGTTPKAIAAFFSHAANMFRWNVEFFRQIDVGGVNIRMAKNEDDEMQCLLGALHGTFQSGVHVRDEDDGHSYGIANYFVRLTLPCLVSA